MIFSAKNTVLICLVFSVLLTNCGHDNHYTLRLDINLPENVLDYNGTPTSAQDRQSLVFSDQGAWFGYGLTTSPADYGGFAGPFLMTQENGVWCSPNISQLTLKDVQSSQFIDWQTFRVKSSSANSHLTQIYDNDQYLITQLLFYMSPHCAVIVTSIHNDTDEIVHIKPAWQGKSFLENIQLQHDGQSVLIHSDLSSALGMIQVVESQIMDIQIDEHSSYIIQLDEMEIPPGGTGLLVLTHSFVFPEYESEGGG